MRSAKLNGSTKISQSSEIDAGRNIHELLVRASHATHEADIAGDEIAVNSVAPFLRRVSEAPRREIKHLVDALQTLDKRLQIDGDRIERDIRQHAALSEQATRLTKIVFEGMKQLPTRA